MQPTAPPERLGYGRQSVDQADIDAVLGALLQVCAAAPAIEAAGG